MSIEKLGSHIDNWPRLQDSPEYQKKLTERVKVVEKEQKYAVTLTKANDVLAILDLPDEQDNIIRETLIKIDNQTLDKLSKQSKESIENFLLSLEEEKTSKTEMKEAKKQEEKSERIEAKLSDIDIKLSKIKSVFTDKILDNNPDIGKKFEALELAKTPKEKDDILNEVLTILKEPWKLESIINNLWWADKNNPKYQEFKNTLVGLDSSFESYFNDLENTSKISSTDKIIKSIEKESWGTVEIDLKSNVSKLSLEWSSYCFEKELDKQALSNLEENKNEKIKEFKRSKTSLKGLYKPFDILVNQVEQNKWEQSFQEALRNSLNGFSKNLFEEMDEVYKSIDINQNIQISESDINSLLKSNSIEEFNAKKEAILEKFKKIALQIEAKEDLTEQEYDSKFKELVMRSKEAKDKELEVLKFLKISGFDLIAKNITDKIFRELKANTFMIHWLELNSKNIDLQNWHFWESVVFANNENWLSIMAKANLVKFMNKMISWNITEPLSVKAIVNWTVTVDPMSLKNEFRKAEIVDGMWWKYSRIIENLRKKV